jgi:hypothetical protein
MITTTSASTFASATGHVFNLCSIFDPDVTGTGHQPLGHDQYANLYHHYQVISCRWRVTICGQGTATGNSFADNHVFSAHVQASSTVSGSDTSNLEQPGAVYATVLAGHRNAPVLTGNFNAAAWFGQRDIRVQDDLRAPFGSNPTEAAYLVISNYNTISNTDVSNRVLVHLLYTVRLIEPIRLGQS